MVGENQSPSVMHSGPRRISKHHVDENHKRATLIMVGLHAWISSVHAVMYLTIKKSDIPCVGRYDRELCDCAALTKTGDDGLQVFGVCMCHSGTVPIIRQLRKVQLTPETGLKVYPLYCSGKMSLRNEDPRKGKAKKKQKTVDWCE